MRTTIDLPEDLHRITSTIARDRSQSLSQTVSSLLREALRLDERSPSGLSVDERTGLPTLRTGGPPVTAEDVRAVEDP